MLSSIPAGDELVDHLDAECEREMLAAAMSLVRSPR